MDNIHTKQLILNLRHPEELTFDNFYIKNFLNQAKNNSPENEIPENNEYIKKLLQNIFFTTYKFLYLWGEQGCGKTHLLLATNNYYRDSNSSIVYLPIKDLIDADYKILDNLENKSMVLIDDLDLLINFKNWNEILFHFFNRIQQNNHCLIVTAKHRPQDLQCTLPDLSSRLASGITFNIKSLDENDKIIALQIMANKKGLTLSEKTAKFLINHCQRDTASLFQLLEHLDQASMYEQRNLTIPFIKKILNFVDDGQ